MTRLRVIRPQATSGVMSTATAARVLRGWVAPVLQFAAATCHPREQRVQALGGDRQAAARVRRRADVGRGGVRRFVAALARMVQSSRSCTSISPAATTSSIRPRTCVCAADHAAPGQLEAPAHRLGHARIERHLIEPLDPLRVRAQPKSAAHVREQEILWGCDALEPQTTSRSPSATGGAPGLAGRSRCRLTLAPDLSAPCPWADSGRCPVGWCPCCGCGR
jgi:hypothetical protein